MICYFGHGCKAQNSINLDRTGSLFFRDEIANVISPQVFIKSVCKSPCPHKCVNSFFTSVTIQYTLTVVWESYFLKLINENIVSDKTLGSTLKTLVATQSLTSPWLRVSTGGAEKSGVSDEPACASVWGLRSGFWVWGGG